MKVIKKKEIKESKESKDTELVSKQELLQAFQASVNADPQWTGHRPPISYAMAKLLYQHLLLTVGNFVIEDGRSVRLDDIGILCMKYRKARSGIAPYSFGVGVGNTPPTTYVSKPKRVMSLRRPFQFEIEDGEEE